jgi:catechol 2,3-dioxygenase-like lactoylglutathione lyase family enzyme
VHGVAAPRRRKPRESQNAGTATGSEDCATPRDRAAVIGEARLNVRAADIDKVYKEWSAKCAQFLTLPKDHARERRAYVRDPDGHLIEVGQTTSIQS